MLKTNFNKSLGNSKEESSSTMKVVDQESIRQRNSKPINRRNSEQSAQTFKVSWQKKIQSAQKNSNSIKQVL